MRNLLVKSSALSLAATLGVVSTAALSQNHADEYTYFGPRFGLVNPDSDRWIFQDDEELSYRRGFSTIAYGLQLGHHFGNGWELRAYYDRLDTNVRAGSDDSGHMYGVDGIYNFRNGIYAGIGAGHTRFNVEEDRFARGTLGYRFALADRWNLGIEYAIQTNSDFTDQYAGANLNYMFGIQTAPTAPRPTQPAEPTEPAVDRSTDTDRDGVPDFRDQCPGTSSEVVVDDDGCTVYVDRNITHELVVNFEFDSARVRPQYFSDIRELAQMMREHEDVTVEIGGHTDLIGPPDYNMDLSRRRAESVRDVLVDEYNISRDRLSTRGYGMTRPVINEVSLDANPVNRRIEATLSTTEEVPLTREMQRRGY